MVGVAGATDAKSTLLASGIAGLLAGSLSMASGEYVLGVHAARHRERPPWSQERRELAETPEAEFEELVGLYRDKGLTEATARRVSEELTAHDALGAHAQTELGIDPDALANPWSAAIASFVAFSVGALLPLLAIVLPPHGWRIPVTVVSVLIALVAHRLASAPAWAARRRAGDPAERDRRRAGHGDHVPCRHPDRESGLA